MRELVSAGGLLMYPILLCSVIAMAIVIERFWALRRRAVCPVNLVADIWQWAQYGQLDASRLSSLRNGSPLGRVLAAAIINLRHSREIMKEAVEEHGRQVVHELERYLNTLGTIASITPLLGLLGTVIGMIKVFAAITDQGVGNPTVLAGGISEALLTTAAGISVAIPSLMFYRHFQRRVTELANIMEQEALKLVEVLHGQREKDPK
ncbi:MAG: MotA/TolQ/ExbB proton channel family protein [Gammaproteobacteria bacterium]|nr:MotA/TolQ/ExbB proton channel family protein [Gammaproteobacteria bacterium]